MGPVNLKPFYRRAAEPVDSNDITMATLVTRNRFKVLSRLASHYQGPISAAIHVNDDETKEEVLAELQSVYDSNPDMQKYVDIHMVLDNFDRQFNLWRNVAKFFSRTDYIMMLDVDFHLCTNFRDAIRNDPKIMQMLASGTAALVVPAFEYVDGDDGLDWHKFPTSKSAMLEEVNAGKLDMFHRNWLKGHGSTNYTKWYESSEVYKVIDYNFSYEPYIIYKKEGSPWCDERFIGYGANKAACLYEIFLSGIDYWVLPNDFLIHQTHEYPEATRRKERQYNRKLYSNFREELCLRYARVFVATGEWDSPKADNLREECQKIRGFRSAMNLPAVEPVADQAVEPPVEPPTDAQ
ncbi:glycosyl-transferase for dystroglycan-domain-containing protein [Fennellomyces sp. T-0311]|nr:glycosyl-transferase for dystroglycan-domain-containing protein [Fennellomyces sp. T-0311]